MVKGSGTINSQFSIVNYQRWIPACAGMTCWGRSTSQAGLRGDRRGRGWLSGLLRGGAFFLLGGGRLRRPGLPAAGLRSPSYQSGKSLMGS